ncbi:MAG: 5'/3'-nucleotidase SurE [Pseudomonadaceae bacterium]|nr:5'/3'-nucleotidase SurE [Pseudomonadaceae bacterium]
MIRFGFAKCSLAALALVTSVSGWALNIVLTNDDGFETDNVQNLFSALVAAGHDVVLSAPYRGQSGTGGQIAFLQPIGPTTVPSEGGLLPAGSAGVGVTTLAEQQFYVDGSPAASVLFGIDVVAPKYWQAPPDLVISGPNQGNNLGIVTPHSGTLGATVTALNKGIPAIAVSANDSGAAQAKITAALIVELVDVLTRDGEVTLPPGTGLNVNVPEIDADRDKADDFSFIATEIGTAADFGLRFYADLGDSVVARSLGVPEGIGLPGVGIDVSPEAAGYAPDGARKSESNALAPRTVTVSPIEGTYARDSRIRSLDRALKKASASSR